MSRHALIVRPNGVKSLVAKEMNWQAKVLMPEVVRRMANAEKRQGT
jgi:hypothetical protein